METTENLKKLAFEKYNQGLNTHYKTIALAAMVEALGLAAKEGSIEEEVFIGIGEILRDHSTAIKSVSDTLEEVSRML